MSSESLTKELVSMSRGDPGQRYNRVPGVVLGKGAFGQVLLAVDKSTNKEVAIKKMEYNPAHLKMMLAEVRHLEMCGEHPNVTQFKGLYHRPSCLLLVLEYVDGLNAFEICKQTPIAPSYIAHIAREVMQGLDFIHTQLQLLHHDIKLQNLMISKDGAVKIADFGLSVRASEEKPLAGTPRYTAPEVIRSKTYTCKIDVWSAGICVFAMAERELPYVDVPERSVDRVIYHNKQTPCLTAPHPIAMQQFVARCLQEEDRRPSAAQMLRHRWLHSACSRAQLASMVTAVKQEIDAEK